MNSKYLEQLGFSGKELKVYVTLLKLGRATPAQLAKLTKIARPTVYSAAKTLVSKGLVAQDLAGKVLTLVALPPDNLSELLEQERKEIKEKEQLVRKAIDELSLIKSDLVYPVPKIRFIEEDGLDQFLHKEFNIWTKSAVEKDKIWWGFQDHTLVENFEKWIHWTWEKIPAELEVRLLTNQSDIEHKLKGKYAKRGMKFWSEKINFTATTWIIGDYLVMINTRQRPYYAVEMHDKLLAHNTAEVFKNVWNLIK